MLPFDLYPKEGKTLLRQVGGSNCRQGYGLTFMQITRQKHCAYCDRDLTDSFPNWLQMAIDHVVPRSACRTMSLPIAWQEDCINKVLACGACNAFDNRFRPADHLECPSTLEAFCDLRDRIFVIRKNRVAERRKKEEAFFLRRAWEDQPV